MSTRRRSTAKRIEAILNRRMRSQAMYNPALTTDFLSTEFSDPQGALLGPAVGGASLATILAARKGRRGMPLYRDPYMGIVTRKNLALSQTPQPLPDMAFPATMQALIKKWYATTSEVKDAFVAGIEAGDKINSDKNKDKVLLITDDTMSDYWSSMLSPIVGAVQINVPRAGAVFNSPAHYVEAMQVISTATPPMLIGSAVNSLFNGGVTPGTCQEARMRLASAVAQTSIDMVAAQAQKCDQEAEKGRFWTPDSTRCKFWVSLWLALWAKHCQGKALNALTSTGNKFLIYKTKLLDKKYGLNDALDGLNAVGIMLMLLRHMAQKGLLSRVDNVGDVWEKHILPFLKEILDNDGTSFKP